MGSFSFLALGIFVGMQHAFEADHLAAVGAMAAGKPSSRRNMAIRGAAWGIGHTLTLFLISAIVIVFGFTLTERFAATLEFAVGVMLVILGIDVLRRIVKDRVHPHPHHHADISAHIHMHSHKAAVAPHCADPHMHDHSEGFPKRAVLVGLMHGTAGSAGLLTLAIAATQSPLTAMSYVAMFGLGSVIGMAVLSYSVAWPLNALQKKLSWVWRALSLAAGGIAISIGLLIMFEVWPTMTASA